MPDSTDDETQTPQIPDPVVPTTPLTGSSLSLGASPSLQAPPPPVPPGP